MYKLILYIYKYIHKYFYHVHIFLFKNKKIYKLEKIILRILRIIINFSKSFSINITNYK